MFHSTQQRVTSVSRHLVLVAGVVAGPSLAMAAHVPASGYVLGSGGFTLVSFDPMDLSSTTAVPLSGAVTWLDDIDFRPLTGELFGYNDETDTYVTIDPLTGVTTNATLPPVVATATGLLGIDFNPSIDRMRTVTELDTNIVYNPTNGGGTVQVTSLFYGPGDPNEGSNPRVVANGYTNSQRGILAGSTVQYVIDAELDMLSTLANNAGTLITIGSLGVDASADAGLDIYFNPVGNENTAYALLNVSGLSGLYTIDLGSGVASLVGNFSGNLGPITGLALTPAPEVPEPASLALLAVPAGLVAFRRRRT